MIITFLHDQVCVDLIVVEPPWDLDPAAVHTSITPLSIQDGQGHISSCLPQQLVSGGLPDLYNPILGGEDGVEAFGHGHYVSSPAETHNTLSLGAIFTRQGDILPNEASDTHGAGAHCGVQ